MSSMHHRPLARNKPYIIIIKLRLFVFQLSVNPFKRTHVSLSTASDVEVRIIERVRQSSSSFKLLSKYGHRYVLYRVKDWVRLSLYDVHKL